MRPCSGRMSPARRTPARRPRRGAPRRRAAASSVRSAAASRARGSRRRRTAGVSSSSGSDDSTRSALAITSGPIPSPGRRTTFMRRTLPRRELLLRVGTSPPAAIISSMNAGIAAAWKLWPSTTTWPESVSISILDPSCAAAAASGQVTIGRPRLMQLRWKIRAKLWPSTQRMPHARIACGTCSRDEPDPEVDARDEDRMSPRACPAGTGRGPRRGTASSAPGRRC